MEAHLIGVYRASILKPIWSLGFGVAPLQPRPEGQELQLQQVWLQLTGEMEVLIQWNLFRVVDMPITFLIPIHQLISHI